MSPNVAFSVGIALLDVLQNWLNWFHFLFLKGGLLIILIDCMIFMSPFLFLYRLQKYRKYRKYKQRTKRQQHGGFLNRFDFAYAGRDTVNQTMKALIR